MAYFQLWRFIQKELAPKVTLGLIVELYQINNQRTKL